MQLNMDCVRDVLLCIEEHTGYNKSVVFVDTNISKEMCDFLGDTPTVNEYQKTLLNKYSADELMYHLKYCLEANLIESSDIIGSMRFMVGDLTPKGHEFIENIRSDTVFNGVKSVAEKVGSSSLNAITQIATNTVAQLIKSQFNLP